MNSADDLSRALRDPGRVAALWRIGLLDTPAEESFDRLTRLAARLLNAPVAMMNLITADRQFCKSHFGLPEPEASSPVLPLEYSFCTHVVASGEPLVVPDASADPRVRDNRATRELGAAAYVGIPLALDDGQVLGSFCVFGFEPRHWTDEEVHALRDLAECVMAEIELRVEIAEHEAIGEALRESEARFRLMVEGSEQVFFYIHDTEGRFEYLSPSVRNVLGYEPDELIGRPYEVLLTGDPSDTLVVEHTDRALSIREGLMTYTAMTRHKDGRTIAVEVVETPIVCGGAVGIQGFARDITERRNAEDELELQRASLEHLFDSAPEAIVLLDTSHHVIQVNPEFTRMFGYTLPEILGMCIDDVIAWEDRRAEAVSLTKRIANGATIGTETVRRHKDGTPIHVSILGTPIRVGESQVAVYGIYRDISDRKEAEIRLGRAEAHYRRLVESSPYGIYALDAGGRFIEFNPAAAAIVGRTPGEVLHKHFEEFVAPEDLDYARKQFRRRISGDIVSEELEVHVLRPSGERRLVRINASPVEDESGAISVHSVARDVTGERGREAQLRRAERLATVGTLVGGVAHELNNPLTAITNFAQLMLLDEHTAGDRESLEIIRREADRAAQIIADLRLLAGQTQEKSGGARRPVDVNDIVRHILKVRRYALEIHNIEIREALADGLPVVSVVRGDIEQVVLNLVINAEHALLEREGSRRIVLRTRASDSGIRLEIQDNGGGIRAEDLERIFDPFWTTKEPGIGTGLGLSLVHTIVAEHGGMIRADSVPGEGTTFTIELPRQPDPATGTDYPVRPERAERPMTREPERVLRLLIVDDEAAVRSSLARYLKRRGHHVETAAEGGEALAHIEAADRDGVTYDMVLADLRMPGLGGDQLLARLRERGGGWERKLIFITGDAVSTDTARILSTAGVPVLLKPFELDEVAGMVERHAGP